MLVKQRASLKNLKSMVPQGLQSDLVLNADFLFLPTSVTMDKPVYLCEPSFPHQHHRGVSRVLAQIVTLNRHSVYGTLIILCRQGLLCSDPLGSPAPSTQEMLSKLLKACVHHLGCEP